MVNQTKVLINMNDSKIKVYSGVELVGHLFFFMNESNIHVWDLEVYEGFRDKGFGSILMHTIMGVASAFNKPIYLLSFEMARDFYINLGFIPQEKFENGEYAGKKVVFIDLDEKVPFNVQVSPHDLVWFPTNVKVAYLPVNYI